MMKTHKTLSGKIKVAKSFKTVNFVTILILLQYVETVCMYERRNATRTLMALATLHKEASFKVQCILSFLQRTCYTLAQASKLAISPE